LETKKLKKVQREKGKNNLDDDEKLEKKESTSVRKQIPEKLQKFLAKIPVIMYVTDFREEALKDVIESLDSDLFNASPARSRVRPRNWLPQVDLTVCAPRPRGATPAWSRARRTAVWVRPVCSASSRNDLPRWYSTATNSISRRL